MRATSDPFCEMLNTFMISPIEMPKPNGNSAMSSEGQGKVSMVGGEMQKEEGRDTYA